MENDTIYSDVKEPEFLPFPLIVFMFKMFCNKVLEDTLYCLLSHRM